MVSIRMPRRGGGEAGGAATAQHLKERSAVMSTCMQRRPAAARHAKGRSRRAPATIVQQLE